MPGHISRMVVDHESGLSIITLEGNPAIVTVEAPVGSVALDRTTGNMYVKVSPIGTDWRLSTTEIAVPPPPPGGGGGDGGETPPPAGAGAAGLTRLVVTAASFSGAIGSTTRLTAVAYDLAGEVIEGATIEWTSSDLSVATVDATGLVTIKAAGSFVITARGMDTRARGVELNPPAKSINYNETLQLRSVIRNTLGSVIARTPAFESSNPGVATVDANGKVRSSTTPGVTTITATVDGRKTIARVLVKKPIDQMVRQNGAPVTRWTMVNVEVSECDHTGLRLSKEIVLYDFKIHDINAVAMTGSASYGVISDGELWNCNLNMSINGTYAGRGTRYPVGNVSGGCKLHGTNGTVMRRIHSHHHHGNGLWCDLLNGRPSPTRSSSATCTTSGGRGSSTKRATISASC